MTVISAVLRELMAAGLDGDALLAAVERIEAATIPQESDGTERNRRGIDAEQRRAKDRERKRLFHAIPAERHRIPAEQTYSAPIPAEQRNTPLLLEDKNIKNLSKRERGTRIPADWTLSDDDRKFAVDRGMPAPRISTEAEKFKNYWTAKSGQAATKTSWPATWRNWVLSALERSGITAPAPPPDPNLPPMHLRPPWMLEGITEEAWEARRMEMIKGLKNGHDKKSEVRGNTAVGQGGSNDAPKLRFEG